MYQTSPLQRLSDAFVTVFDVYIVGFLDWFAQMIGPALIVFALTIIASCTYVFFAFIVPFHNWGIVTAVGTISLGLFFLFNSLYNYYKCVSVSPGIPPTSAEIEEAGEVSALGNRLCNHEPVSDDEEQQGRRVRYKQATYAVCGKCDRIRPPRTHHCSVCKSCVMKMDHHCPWIYNCVGEKNQKYFYLFLLHVFLVDVFFVLSSCAPALNAFGAPITDPGRPWIIMTFVIAAVLSVAIGAFLAFHTYLIVHNMTTIEFMIPDRESRQRRSGRFIRNPHDQGFRRNWDSVFGQDNGSFWTFKWSLSFLHKDEDNDMQLGPTLKDPQSKSERADLVPPKE
jgi:hypothetical protein